MGALEAYVFRELQASFADDIAGRRQADDGLSVRRHEEDQERVLTKSE